MTEHTSVATIGRIIALTLDGLGCDGDAVIEQAGLDPTHSYNPHARYPSEAVQALWRIAAQISGDPAFGLRVPGYSTNTVSPAMTAAFASSETLRGALDRLCRMFPFVNHYGALVLEEREETAWLVYRLSAVERATIADEAMDALFAAIVVGLRNAILPEFAVSAVELMRPLPDDPSAYTELYRAPVLFDCGQDRIGLASALLDQPLLGANNEMAQLSEQLIANSMNTLTQSDLITRTRALLQERLADGEPDQAEIATALHLSSRQFRRKLSALGTGYSALLADCRHKMAKKYLLQNTLPLSEITQRLGFSDQSNFSKAFKRWEGESPAQFRQRHS
ncbi:AraC family transcriptional regulator [Ferrimonas pelagia]|uniref:AraC family transcriptional regulator n=1 Tax=Ferrimonas pelagia TaxID=1177826 RepID=A0ABP9EF18_9GAMM